MRYTLINGLLFLATPLSSLALPLEPNPNDQGGVWDPSGQYRKGHYDGAGNFVANEGWNDNDQYNNGQYNNGQYNNGQYRGNDWNNGQYNNDQNNNGRWQRRSLNSRPFGDHRISVGMPGAGLPGIHARSEPNNQNNNGWTDANGQWHSNEDGQGWRDSNGDWHKVARRALNARSEPNDQNNNGWTDANGQWHSNQNGQQDDEGWRDANGDWHHVAKRNIPDVNALNIPFDQNNNGWTDANGQWHSTDYSQGWTDANGQWHSNNNGNNNNGWTDSNGQWHSNQNGQGWTDANGDWHQTAKRGFPAAPVGAGMPGTGAMNPGAMNSGSANPAAAQPGTASMGTGAGANPLTKAATGASALHARDYRDDDYYRNNDYNHNNYESDREREEDREDYDRNREEDRQTAKDVVSGLGIVPRWWPFTSGDWHRHHNNDWDNDNYDNDEYNDKCKNNNDGDRSGFDCRHDWDVNRATPTARAVAARSYPSGTNWNHSPQSSAANPGTGISGNSQGYGASQGYPKLTNDMTDKTTATKKE